MRLFEFLDQSQQQIDMHRLDDQLTPNFWKVATALKEYDFDVRIVGGAVRDLLLDQHPRDIDLATTALPDEIIWIMQKHGLTLTTKGITHGTIKVKFDGDEEYEITSLDYRVRVNNGRLEIHHDSDWRKDAARRDFSINALSMDLDGNVFDYLGGIKDLKDHRIRFLAPIGEKIEEDPVLILRFFKLVSKLVHPEFDPETLHAVQRFKGKLTELTPERVRLELSNIHHGPNAAQALRVMRRLHIDKIIDL